MGKPNIQIQAVIYDLDGVIVDTRKYHFDALNKALRKYGFELSEEEHSSMYEGLPTTVKLELLSKEKGLPVELHEQIVEDKYQEIAQSIKLTFKKDRLKTELLRRVQKLGVRQVLCTNTTKSTTMTILEIMGITNFFDFCMTRADITRPKPDPELYCNAILRLQMAPNNCLIIEDSEHGLNAARASGAHVLKADFVDQVNYQFVSQEIKRLK